MSASPLLYVDIPRPVKARYQSQAGFTLVEVLMCLTMLALIMLPFTLTIGTSAQSTHAAYLQSSRTILLNSLKSEIYPTNPTYATTYADSSIQTDVTDGADKIGYWRTVDTTTAGATNAMKRTTLFYLYTNTTDSSGSARYKSTLVSYPKVFRMHFGTGNNIIDTVGRFWENDKSGTRLYDSTNKAPGWTTSHATSNFWGNDILNTTGNDDLIFQAEETGTPLNFSMDVDNGAYTVKVYFCETNSGINGTTSLRRMNISLEGSQMNTSGPYSPYESTGGTNYAQLLMYDTYVSDGVLNITISQDPSANDSNANPHAIEVIRRTMK